MPKVRVATEPGMAGMSTSPRASEFIDPLAVLTYLRSDDDGRNR